MNLKVLQTEQKLMGAYYTPDELIKYMLKWAIDENKAQKILEPSAGDGAFIKNITKINSKSSVTAVEINFEETQKIPTNKHFPVTVINADFYNFYEDKRVKEKYDLIMGNPPYIRYQFLTEEQREFQSDILKNNGLKPNKLINSWVAFSVASVELLNEGGKFAFVLPSDLLQVTYAKQLRKFFMASFSEMSIVTFANGVFEGIQQDVILLFAEKKQQNGDSFRLRTLHINDLAELEGDLKNIEFDDYTNYEADKWSTLNLDGTVRRYYDSQLKSKTISLKDIVKVEVGITTGNNSFFAVNDSIVNKFHLEKHKRPLLGRSVETFGTYYTKEDLQNNRNSGKRIWLLDFNVDELDSDTLNYIKFGEKEEENLGYKLQIRNNWYEVPSIWVPDAFLLRRIGEFPKFIVNDINAVSTDTFHRVKLNEESMYSIDETMFLFYSSPALLSLELEGRVFGGGALEILPGDMNNVLLPKIANFSDRKDLFVELDYKFRNKIAITEIVKWVDSEIQKIDNSNLIDFELTYSAWREIKETRYKRKK